MTNTPTQTERCQAMVQPGGYTTRRYRCSRKAVAEGYCRQHSPEAVRARQERSEEIAERNFQRSPYMMQRRAEEQAESLRQQLRAAHEANESVHESRDKVKVELLRVTAEANKLRMVVRESLETVQHHFEILPRNATAWPSEPAVRLIKASIARWNASDAVFGHDAADQANPTPNHTAGPNGNPTADWSPNERGA